MNSYFNAFQSLAQSIEQLLKDESNSLEIKQSATNLKESVQPCLEELKQSATRLKKLVLVCSDELYQADNIWQSKPRIVEAAKQEIWEQLGEISGRVFKIRLLINQLRNQTVEQAKKSWYKRLETLKKTWFVDSKTGKNKDVSAWDKDKFIADVCLLLDLQSQDINLILQESLKFIYQELTAIDLLNLQSCIHLLEESKKTELQVKLNHLVSEIKAKFSNPIDYVAGKNQKLTNAVNPALMDLSKQAFFLINWLQFNQFNGKVIWEIESIITSIFDERVQLATQALEQAIAFYNDFLERQERYQQETPEQRKAEKAWIDQQRQQLEQVQDGIEAILNTSL